MNRWEQIEEVIETLEAMDNTLEALSDLGDDVYTERKELDSALKIHKNSLRCFYEGEEIASLFQGALFFPTHTNCVLEEKTAKIALWLQLLMEEV